MENETTSERALEVAKIIASQIRMTDKWAIGYRQPMALRERLGGLRFKVNTNSQICEVILDWNDTYIVRYSRVRKGVATVVEELNDIYCDQLGEVLYQMTQVGVSKKILKAEAAAVDGWAVVPGAQS